MERIERMKARILHAPDQPGVYFFKDEHGAVLYVGKARSLRDRLRSYFSPAGLNTRTMRMINAADDFSFLVTDSEVEALIIESNLIKSHRPKYNVRLRDDKHYPYIRITMEEDFPRVQVVRRVADDGSKYFGPFTNSGILRASLDILRQVFPHRSCSNHRFNSGRRPCLYFHTGRCQAPCDAQVSVKAYREQIDGLLKFLSGQTRELMDTLKEKMDGAAEDLDFESAARYRDQLEALNQFQDQQHKQSASLEDLDVVGIAANEGEVAVTILFMRDGKIVGRDHFMMHSEAQASLADSVEAVLQAYYSHALLIPQRILIPKEPPSADALTHWLSEQRGTRVFLHRPQRGEKRRLVQLATRNAKLYLQEQKAKEHDQEPIRELAQALGLPRLPRRIEGFDVSNLFGQMAVGAMVVFEEGVPVRHQYRRFRIEKVEGVDDYAMLKEVLDRRFSRYLRAKPQHEQDSSFATVPDLIVIDGGKGQLSAALEILKPLGLADIPVVGLAKQEEDIFVPDQSDPLSIAPDHAGSQLLQRIRDEAHRFAIDYHRRLRKRHGVRSILDDIPGIGPKRRNALLRAFDSPLAMAEASMDELAAVPGMTRRAAKEVKRFLLDRYQVD